MTEKEVSADELTRILESRYRFGTPLVPAGFQHDVLFEGGVALSRERFECARRGPVLVSGDHANVFPDDVVTAETVVNEK